MKAILNKIRLKWLLNRVEKQIKIIISNRKDFVRIYHHDYKTYNCWQKQMAINNLDILFDIYKESYMCLYHALQDRRNIKQKIKTL